MHLSLIIETDDPERIWNAFRLANTALESEHTVEVFLLGDGVAAPAVDTGAFNPRGVLMQFVGNNGTLYACGTCLDSRDLEESELRPRATMGDLLGMIERADETITIG